MNFDGWLEMGLRFLLGGAIVSGFAVFGEAVQPKTLAGVFGAAPSVALATLGMAFWTRGSDYARIEARAMMCGALAFVGYSIASSMILRRRVLPVWLEAGIGWLVWLAVAFASWETAAFFFAW